MNDIDTRTGMISHLATGFHPALIRGSQSHTKHEAPQRPALE